MDLARFDLRKAWGAALALVVLLLLAALPTALPGYTVVLVYTILMYIILTVSWVIFSAPTGYISLAPAAFFGVGVYTSAVLGMDATVARRHLLGWSGKCLSRVFRWRPDADG